MQVMRIREVVGYIVRRYSRGVVRLRGDHDLRMERGLMIARTFETESKR